MLLTGTPSGVGPVKPGEVVECVLAASDARNSIISSSMPSNARVDTITKLLKFVVDLKEENRVSYVG